jgi:hypothetical protein
MKRFSVVGLVFLSLASLAPTVQGQLPQRFVVDSGLVTLGPNQVLRLGITIQTDTGEVYFRRMEYMQDACSGGVCKHTLASQTRSGPMRLASGEAASMDIPNTGFAVRGVVVTNRRSAQVSIHVIDATTGDIVSFKEATLDLN